MAVPVRRSDLHRLNWSSRNSHLNLLNCADLHHRFRRLLENQLLVDSAHLGGFLVGLPAARAVFFGGRERNVVLEMANARGIIGIDLERMLVALEVNFFALGENLVLAMGLVP